MNMSTLKQKALELHKTNRGKIEITSKVAISTSDELSLAYTPGVAEPCKEIAKDKKQVYTYTNKGNLVAIVTDGTAVLGLGNLGPEGAYPVMEGKAALFKAFANVDAVPICLATTDPQKIIETVLNLAPTFGGINLEDIGSPTCFEIEDALKAQLDIPVFHDDQHGTAIVVFAALINALKVVEKSLDTVKIVVNGIGAAGSAVAKLLLQAGAKNMLLVDRYGILVPNGTHNDATQNSLAERTNPKAINGDLACALQNADVFIGVSRGGLVTAEMVQTMQDKAIIFAMANPVPEIFPEEALKGGALVIGTGRSDYPNQINNVLAFPGIFRGALDAGATCINEDMKVAAAYAIANVLTTEELNPECIIPNVFDKRVVKHVAAAVAKVARENGLTRA